MKILRRSPLPSPAQRRGVALVIVLACVFLLTVVVVAFLAGIGTEVQSSKFYASGSSVKLLAQSATDLVMAEIRDATADGTLCWASQPGMIRTFDTSGKPVQYYKLYSDDSMVTTTFDHTKTLVPDGINTVNGSTVAWYNQKGVYVDLNEPILVNGAEEYPIVYGATKTLTGSTNDLMPITFSTGMSTTPLPPLTTPLPPIILPNIPPQGNANTVQVLGSNKVVMGLPWGFWLNGNTPVNKSATNANMTNLGSISATVPNQAAPMPVKWLYTLQDGSLVTPDTDTATSSTVTFNNSPIQPSFSNPIVGRMAFWTDDESCKVNINTAGEGTYWDVPRADCPNSGSTAELTLGMYAPAQYEFQRFPGHPAMTSLGTVFNVQYPTTTYTANTEALYSILPRLGTGGSVEGTVQTTQGKTFTSIVPAANRLFASPDEFLYAPMGSATTPLPRSLNNSVSNAPTINQTLLKQNRFFLTASGRSPDVNLFNRPRVCIWPISINNTATYRSVYDQLIAFCSTMRTDLATPYLYYFQRQDPTDPYIDLPTANDNTKLDRNRRLLEYLRTTTNNAIPGFAGTFAAKYSSTNPSGGTATDRDQILTEIFDYIRSTNLVEPGTAANPLTPYTVKYSPSTSPTYTSNAGIGQVIPIIDQTNNTRGFGRFRSVQGATLLFIANADGDQPGTLIAPTTSGGAPMPAAHMRRIQTALMVQLFDPSVGSAWDNINLNMSITGMSGFTTGGLPLLTGSSITLHQANGGVDNGTCYGDQLGFTQLWSGNDNVTGTFFGPSVDVPNTASTFAFSGGTLTVQLQTPIGSTNPGTTVQKATLTFPAGNFPLPGLNGFAPSNVNDYAYTGAYEGGPYNFRFFNNVPTMNSPGTLLGNELAGPQGTSGRTARVGQSTAWNSASWFTTYDTVRSVAIPNDPRLVAAQFAPLPTQYSPVGNYSSATATVAGMHSLYNGIGAPFWGGLQGKLVADANYDSLGTNTGTNTNNGLSYTAGSVGPGGNGGPQSPYDTADVFNPTTGTGAPLDGVAMGTSLPFAAGMVLGDWDNGIGSTRDGPYINKADEGDAGSSSYTPYIWKERVNYTNLTTGLYSPNRELASAVTFGSLPTEVFAANASGGFGRPWQTLLFRPGPIGHRGLGISLTPPTNPATSGADGGPPYANYSPPDHLLLDLFTMPVVEPYAISEPLSTAGRINMNSLIVPFNYINRDTGLRALLKDEKVISIADSQAKFYKQIDYGNATTAGLKTTTNMRYPVNVDATLAQFYDRRFNKNDIFRSPSEICDIDIVPSDNSVSSDPYPFAATTSAPTRAAMDAYWNTPTTGHRLTGDNSRERIYSTLYPRLTTKSNTFTVHFRVQSLKQALPSNSAAAAWQVWREGTDQVTGEYRGSQVIERYVDPNDPSIPDFADPANSSATLASYYRFRVLATKQFAP